ncbi:DUF190 domain-containing protein [Methylophaga sp.]|uniref:DUF190 domain-containing protein n=1 Tax=Methylophaga sp. TaxID=2024840 RepID=UPI003F69849F
MKRIDVIMVRVYLADGRDQVNKTLRWMEKSDVRGFTVFRGVAGLGSDHKLHKASILDLSSELPVVIEFYDIPERVNLIIEQLEGMVKPDHIVSWPAQSGI